MPMHGVIGTPGPQTERAAAMRRVRKGSHAALHLPGGVIIDGSKSRDPLNSDISVLRAGLMMGRITSGGKYAPSVLGVSTEALTHTGTTLTVSAATATELVRRIGSSGTFKLTGPPTAAGTVKTVTVTYSAVNTGTGAITITAIGVNEVHTMTFGAAATGGTAFRLTVPKANGVDLVTTDAIAWNATDGTWLGNIQTALDAATGVVNGIVVTGAAPDTALTFTFSGTGYAGNSYSLIYSPNYTALTSVTTGTVVRTTTGVNGAFIAGSFVQPTSGAEEIKGLIDDGWGVEVNDVDGNNKDVMYESLLVGGVIDSSQIVNWPSDTSLIAWVKAQLNRASGNAFVFDDAY